jgi:hypothetical protein
MVSKDSYDMPGQIGDGLLMRWAGAVDTEELAEFNLRWHSEDPDGTYPLSATEPGGWALAFAAISVGALLPGLLMLPTAVAINRFTGTPNDLVRLARFVIGVVGLSLLMSPFSVLIAILFSEGRTAALLFFLVGIILINWMANHLSRTRQRSEQQVREFAVLEEVGEALIQAPPDGVTDAQDNTDTLYDEHRLLANARANLGRSAGEIEEAILQSINVFVGDVPQFDDITLLVAIRI